MPPQNQQIKEGDVEHGMEHEESSAASSITVEHEPADNGDPNHHRTSHVD